MNRLFKSILITVICALIILPLFARTATDDYTGRKWDVAWQDIGNMNMTITNYGIFGHNVLTGDAGGYWPSGYPGENYIYGCGLWFGALVDTAIIDGDTLRDTLVSIGYNPNSGSSEMVPGDGSDSPIYSNVYEKVYKSTADWPPKNGDGDVIFDSTISMQDTYCEYSDKDASQHLTVENLPLGLEIFQSTYAWVGPLKEDIIFMVFRLKNAREDGLNLNKCYMGVCTDNDIGNESGTSANDLLGFIDTMTYEGTFTQMNLGYQFQLDPEAGWAHDPGIVAFKYMQSPIATERVDVYHDGSVVINPGIDTIIDALTGDITFKPREIGMTSFNYFTLATDPSTKQERYQVLAGYDHLNFDINNPEASFRPFPIWGEGTAGYPGQTQSEAGDKRFLMGAGPFTLPNDSMATVVVAVMVAKDVDELLAKAVTAQSVFDAGFKGPVAPEIVNFTAKGLNKKAVLYWDNAVEKIADKYYEDASDPGSLLYNPTYLQYDVVGYNVYRSATGAGGTWELLQKYDLIDDITAVIYDSTIVYVPNGAVFDTIITYLYESLGTNTGVPYFYVDSNLINGIAYHYMITAYDYNFNSYAVNGTDTVGTDPMFLEGAGKDIAVQPRLPTLNYQGSETEISLAENFITFDYTTTVTVLGDTIVAVDTTTLTTSIHPVDTDKLILTAYPIVDTLIDKLTAGTYFTMKFTGGSISDNEAPVYDFSVYKHLGGVSTGTLVGASKLEMTKEQYVTEQGAVAWRYIKSGSDAITSDGIIFNVESFTLNFNKWPEIKERLSVNTNGYVNDYTTVKTAVDADFSIDAKQYFRGGKWYRLIWHEAVVSGDTTLTLEVWDKQTDMEIPYGNTVFGDCWHFNPSIAGDFDEFYSDVNSSTAVKSGLYLPYIKLNFSIIPTVGRPSTGLYWPERPVEGDVWDIVINYPDSSLYEVSPIGAEFTIDITASEFTTVADSMLENIKVVPNPYVVRSEYDLDYTYRKLYFTNLPNECTINIYTLSGDLIKTIEHSTEFYRYESTVDSSLVDDITNGSAAWSILTENDQIPAPGLYLYKVMTPSGASYIGKFAIIK